ncbi:hypothetical protein C475_18726 [Halosimplex carlsbadense 2-9-1]|uniref:Uncharacterized protein n=1 Tax=Halosimplex carlsbadense 2-9-1 TaxID=797114 RepID=M0CDY6_9EURY|nr:hypothetical protein [Halosimplex carlsbadense]ELZ21481.1 hypothetical protein C475_18726 [Halosimplex carlsbadense 2-9-1]
MHRRDFLSSVAALAATRWEQEDYDIDNVEEWAPLEDGGYTTGEFTPSTLTTSWGNEFSGGAFPDEKFSERTVTVFYDTTDVNLCFEGRDGDPGDGGLRAGGLIQLTPEQARELGASLYQAGEELERRLEVANADD